jgi:hypothetical protein
MMAQEIRRKQVSSVALLREGTQRQQQPLLLALAIARKVMLLGGNPGTKSGD